MSLKFTEDEPQPDPELGWKIQGTLQKIEAKMPEISGPTVYQFTVRATLTYEQLQEMNGGKSSVNPGSAGSGAILIILPPRGSDARPDNGPGAGT